MPAVAQLEEQKQKQIAFKRILVAADFSSASARALAHALALARRYHAELSLVHAVPPEPREPVPLDPTPRELDREWLNAEREMQRLELEVEQKDLAHRILLERGTVWSVLSFVIQGENPDLLVLGTHGRSALKKLVLGSVAEEVLRLAPCPVLTIGPKAPLPSSDAANFKSILFATDFGAASVKAFLYALSLAQDCKAKLVLVHVVPPITGEVNPGAYAPPVLVAEDVSAWESRVREESLSKLRQLVAFNSALASEPEYVVAIDFLPDGIIEIAGRYAADLIVMGTNHTESVRMAAHMPWAVIHEVLCRAKCPVLTVAG